MKLANRIRKVENTATKSQYKRLLGNIAALSNEEIEPLFQLLAKERIDRGLCEEPEIEAARAMYDSLLDRGENPIEAIQMVIETAKASGIDLTENDVKK